MAGRKIVYLLPPGGDDRHLASLAKGVVEQSGGRFEVELISVSGESGSWPVSPGVSVRRLPATGHPKDPNDAISWEIPDAIARADLVHLHQAFTRGAEVGLLAAGQLRKPICVTDHGIGSSTLGKHIGALDLADLFIATSDYAASQCQTSATVAVVKGGVDSSRFRPSERPLARDRVLFVGPILPREGVDRLIEALPTGLPLTVCGPAPNKDYLSRLRAIGRDKAVGFVTDAGPGATLDLYRRAWATVLPAVRVDCYGKPHEPGALSSLPLLESMACGTPAIASRLGAFPEYVLDGETGFLVEDPEGLTEHLHRLANDPAMADRMGRRGRLLVEHDLDYRVAGSRLLDLYASLIDDGSESEAAA